MASVSKTIEIIFAGTDKMSGTIGDVSGKIGDFAGSVEDATKPLLDLSTAILKVDAVLGAMAIGGIAVAINQAGKFGDSFAEISTLTDATGDALNTFEADILSYSRNSTASIDDINGAIYSAISAGTDYKDSLELLTISEQLSVAGKADLEATTRLLVSSLNAYGASTDEATAYSDALFKTVKLGQTTLPELAQSLAQVSTTAANSGVSFDELMASIAAVTATGAPTSQAITAIKAAISAIVKPSSEAAKEAAKLGISFDAGALATKGLDGVLKDVYSATGGATEQIVKLFGSVESLPAVMTLGADTSGKFASTLEEFKSKAGATAEAYAKMAANMILANQNLANNVNATFIQIGSELLETYSGIVSELADVFKAVGTSIDAGTFDSVFTALNTVGDDIATFLEDLANTLPEAFEKVDWSGFIASFEGLAESMADIFGDFDPKDPQDVADAIQFVIDSLGSLADVTKGMVDVLGPVINKILEWADAFNNLESDTKVLIGSIIEIGAVTSVAAGIIAGAALVVKGLSIAFSGMGVKAAVTSITSMGPAIATVIGTTGGQAGLLGLAAAAGYAAGTIINDNVPAVTTISQAVLGWADSILNFTGTQKDANKVSEENAAFVNAQAMALDRAQISLDAMTRSDTKFEVDFDLSGMEANLAEMDRLMGEVGDSDPTLVPVEFDADKLRAEWRDLISGGLESMDLTQSELEMPFSVMYKWTDSGGGDHYSNQAPDQSDVFGDVTEVKVPMAVEVEKTAKEKALAEIDDVKTEVEEKLSNFEMAMAVEVKIETNFDQVNDALSISESAYESYAGTVEAAYTSGADIISGASSAIASMADAFNQATGLDKYKVEAWTEEQIKLQDREMDLREKLAKQNEKHLNKQEDLVAEQIDSLDAHRRTLEKYIDATEGEKTIKLEMSGVEPEVEAIMYKILKKIQLRANESGAEFLLAAAA